MPKILLSVISFLMLANVAQAQDSILVGSTYIKFEGSAPPLPSIYGCVHALEGRPYSEMDAQKCLAQIKSTKYFLSATAAPKSLGKGSIRLEVHLTAPTLRITEIGYELDEQEQDSLRAFLKQENRVINIGDAYDSNELGMILQRIQLYFASKDRSEGIALRTDLDYRALTARLHFKFFNGPTSTTQDVIVPHHVGCKDEIRGLNLTDVDDNVPLPLVESSMMTKAFSCFDQAKVSQDESTLQKTGLFKSVKIYVTGKEGQRSVDVEIHGKPVTVSDVNVIGYGLVEHGALQNVGTLQLHVGDTYKASVARETADSLARRYETAAKRVSVSQNVKQVDESKVEVTFSVLVYDADELYIDGEYIPSLPKTSY